MSISLVKKSLEIITENQDDTGVSPKTNYKKNKQKLKKKRLVDEKKNAIIAVQKVREKSLTDNKIDKVNLNVQRLLKLSSTNTIHRKLEDKLLEKIGKKKPASNNVDEQKTAFTEDDFIKFEREYLTD